MFLNGDGDPNRHPVSHQCEEIGEDLAERVASCKRADSVYDYAHSVPYETWDLASPSCEELEIYA